MSVEVINFGCRMNALEGEQVADVTRGIKDRNIAIFNGCAVTNEAERKLRQDIRKFKKNNPKHDIIVTGCAAQIDPTKYNKMQEVDRVLGNIEKLSAESYDFQTQDEKIKVNDIMSISETSAHLLPDTQNRARAFLQVQNGCNHRCTFCIIPYGRGNSRSVPMGEVVKQAKTLEADGYNEIVLTGIDLTDYGSNLPNTPSLGRLVESILTNTNIPRIRLSSIDVAEIDPLLFDIIVNEKRLMPHLHLSLQAGDNMILKRMKRRHTREDVLEFCNAVRAKRPEIVFGADIITGFPTETDQMFENTRSLVEEITIPHLHVFPYSAKEGTPAANIPAKRQVPGNIKKQRSKILRELSIQQLISKLDAEIGKPQNIVIETKKDGSYIGRTETFYQINLPKSEKYCSGDIIPFTPKQRTDLILH